MQNPNAQKITHAQKSIFEAINKLVTNGKEMLSYGDIISKSGYCRTTVINAVRLLSALGLIQTSKPDCKHNENLPYTYKVIKE